MAKLPFANQYPALSKLSMPKELIAFHIYHMEEAGDAVKDSKDAQIKAMQARIKVLQNMHSCHKEGLQLESWSKTSAK